MPINLDRRTRLDSALQSMTPAAFFAHEFVELVPSNGPLVAAGMQFLGARPLGLHVEGESWSIVTNDDTIAVIDGIAEGALELHLTVEQFSDWVQNQQSFNGMMVARSLTFDPADLRDISIWDALTTR